MSGIHYLICGEIACEGNRDVASREVSRGRALLTIVLGVVAPISLTVALGYQRILRSPAGALDGVGVDRCDDRLAARIRSRMLAMRMPRGAMTEQDERERLFELKSTRIAFFVLAICS